MSFTANINEIVEKNQNGLLSKHISWCRVPLDDVAEILNGFPFDSKKFNSTEGKPLIRIRDIVRGFTETYFDGEAPEEYWIEEGSILVGMDGDFNVALWRSERALLNQRTLKLKPNHTFYNENLLRFAIAGYLQAVNENTPSVTVKHLSSKTVLSLPLPLPPLAEQARIANALDGLLAQVDTLKARLDALPALIKRFRQSVLSDAVAGALTNSWRERNPADVQNSSGQLGQLIEEMRNGLSAKPNESSQGVPILRISAVRSGSVDQTDIRFLECDEAEKQRYAIKKGDLLFTRYNGSLDFVGVCGLVKQTSHEVIVYPDKIIRVRCKTDIILPEYLEIFFAECSTRQRVMDLVKSTSGQKGISGQDLKGLCVTYPGISEQSEVVRRVEELSAYAHQMEARLADARQRVDALTQSILAKAFRGELVPQDPNDEPASVLLERIAAQRAADPKPKRGRKAAAH